MSIDRARASRLALSGQWSVSSVNTPDARETALAAAFARERLGAYLAVREPSLSPITCDSHVHASSDRVSVLVRTPQSDAHEAAYRALAADLSARGFDRNEARPGDRALDPFERWDWPRSNWSSSTPASDD